MLRCGAGCRGPQRKRAAFSKSCGLRGGGDVAIVAAVHGTWLRLGQQAYGVVGVVGVAGTRSAKGFGWIAGWRPSYACTGGIRWRLRSCGGVPRGCHQRCPGAPLVSSECGVRSPSWGESRVSGCLPTPHPSPHRPSPSAWPCRTLSGLPLVGRAHAASSAKWMRTVRCRVGMAWEC
jgi:hypothetical protein